MPEAISNASPLIQLAKIGQLSLLARLHPRVLIPEAVYREVVLAGRGRPGAEAVANAQADGWLVTMPVPGDSTLDLLREQLGDGEAEAIRLALVVPSGVVLLDDMAARTIAGRLGLRVTGTLGLLLRAKRLGYVPQIRPLVDQLRADGRFYVAPFILAQILAAAGE
jgi:predicted nucleic acid-binding protein